MSFKDSGTKIEVPDHSLIRGVPAISAPWELTKEPFKTPDNLELDLSTLDAIVRRSRLLDILNLTEEDTIPYPSLDPLDPNFNAVFDPYLYHTDFRYVCESFFKIQSKNQTVIDFKLNLVQLSFLLHRTGRDLLLKARQHGFTTLMLAYYLWDTLIHKATTTIVLAHEKKPAALFLEKIRLMIASLPENWRPKMTKNSDEMIQFSHGSRIIVQAIKDTAGRSITCNNLLLSEFGFFGQQVSEESLLGLTESVPESNERKGEPGGSITGESTPRGVGNTFYKECQDADNEKSAFRLFVYPWFLNPDYDNDWKEQKQISLKTHTERGMRAWQQEYCCSFLQSQRSFFSAEDCKPKSIYTTPLLADPRGVKYPKWVKVYREPIPGQRYVLGADVAQGLEHGDFSDATLLSRGFQIEEAHIHGKISPEQFAECLYWLGRKYNWALIGVEAQQSGHTVLYRLLNDLEYPNLFYHLSHNHLVRNKAPPLGWQTNVKTRPLMLDEFRAALEDNLLYLAYKGRKSEMEVFIYDENGKPVASPGYCDDTVISGSIAHMLLKYPDFFTDIEASDLDFTVLGG